MLGNTNLGQCRWGSPELGQGSVVTDTVQTITNHLLASLPRDSPVVDSNRTDKMFKKKQKTNATREFFQRNPRSKKPTSKLQ